MDSLGAMDTATVTFTINGVNDAPDAVADALEASNMAEDTTLEVLANDSDPENDDFTIVDILPGDAVGTIQIAGDGLSLLYQPTGDLIGSTDSESFQYVIEDEHGAQSTATVTVMLVANLTPSPSTTRSTAMSRRTS